MIALSITPIYKLFSHAYHISSYDEDIYIAAKQVSQYLLGSYYVDLNDGYRYISYEGKEMVLMYDKQRLVKKSGYEILLSQIDSVDFYINDHMVYMKVTREEKDYCFLVGYAREKETINSDEEIIE